MSVRITECIQKQWIELPLIVSYWKRSHPAQTAIQDKLVFVT